MLCEFVYNLLVLGNITGMGKRKRKKKKRIEARVEAKLEENLFLGLMQDSHTICSWY